MGLERLRGSIRTLLAADALGLNVSLLVRSRVQLGAVDTGVVGAHSTESTSEGAVAGTSALDGKGLSHDGAALPEHLEVRHASSTGGDIVASGRGRKRAKRGGGRLVEERAHGPRLAEKSLHDGQWSCEAKFGGRMIVTDA